MRLLRSSRFRRRAGRLAVCLAVAGVVAFVGIHFSNTGHAEKQVFEPGKPQLVPKAPKADTFTPAEQRQVRAVAVRFVASAVYRKHVADSFALTTSELHQGLSPTDWATGTIPVVPYPGNAVDEVRWRLDYSYANEVGLKVAFYPKARSGVDRQVFDIALQNHGKAGAPHWLVSYWAPEGGVQLSRGDPRAPVGRHGSAEAAARSGLAVRAGRPDRRRSGRRDRVRRDPRPAPATACGAGGPALQVELEPVLSAFQLRREIELFRPVRDQQAPGARSHEGRDRLVGGEVTARLAV